ncbi:MAG: sensor histidine kinase [Ignavibacteriales bacterium]
MDWVIAQILTSPDSTAEYCSFVASREGRRRISTYVTLSIKSIEDPRPFFVDQEDIGRLRAAQGYPLSDVLDVAVQTKNAIWNLILTKLAGTGSSVPVSLLKDIRTMEAALDTSRVILAKHYVSARENKIHVQGAHLESMYRLASSAFSTRDLSHTVNQLTAMAKEVFQADECGVMLGGRGFSTSTQPAFEALSKRVVGRLRSSLSRQSPFSARVRVTREGAPRLEHWLLSQVSAYGEPIGIVYVCRPRVIVSSDEKNLLQSFASALAGTTANSNLFRALAEKEEVLSELVRNTVEAQEDQRKRLAAEIHDGPTQSLMAAMYRLEACQTLFQRKESSAFDELRIARDSIEQTVEDMRRIIYDLRPLVLDDLGLVASIRSLAKAFMDEGGPRIVVHEQGSQKRLPHHYELALYRIVQESINNIRRHSGAKLVEIALGFTKESVRLTITDNGQGFTLGRSLNELVGKGKFGLVGMRERVERLGGQFEVRTMPNQGTTVEVTLPY